MLSAANSLKNWLSSRSETKSTLHVFRDSVTFNARWPCVGNNPL